MILTICIQPQSDMLLNKKCKYGQLVDRNTLFNTRTNKYTIIEYDTQPYISTLSHIHNMIGYYENQKDYIKNINTNEPIIIDNRNTFLLILPIID